MMIAEQESNAEGSLPSQPVGDYLESIYSEWASYSGMGSVVTIDNFINFRNAVFQHEAVRAELLCRIKQNIEYLKIGNKHRQEGLIQIDRIVDNLGSDQVFPSLSGAATKLVIATTSLRDNRLEDIDRQQALYIAGQACKEYLNATIAAVEEEQIRVLADDCSEDAMLNAAFDIFAFRQMYNFLAQDTQTLLDQLQGRVTSIMKQQARQPVYSTAILALGVVFGGMGASSADKLQVPLHTAGFAVAAGIFLNQIAPRLAVGTTKAWDDSKFGRRVDRDMEQQEQSIIEQYAETFNRIGTLLQYTDYDEFMSAYTDSKIRQYQMLLSSQSLDGLGRELVMLLRKQQQEVLIGMISVDGVSPNTVAASTYILEAVTVAIATGVVNYVAGQHSILDLGLQASVFIAGMHGVEQFLTRKMLGSKNKKK